MLSFIIAMHDNNILIYISISSFIEKTGLTCLQQKKKFVNTSIKISSMTEIYFYRFKSELRKFEIELQSILPCS